MFEWLRDLRDKGLLIEKRDEWKALAKDAIEILHTLEEQIAQMKEWEDRMLSLLERQATMLEVLDRENEALKACLR